MNKVLIVSAAFLLATMALPASAEHRNGGNRYDGGYGGHGYGPGYNNAYYSSYYHRARQQRREHRYLHQELGELHNRAHDEGFYDRHDHADTHDALDSTNEQWHRDHPYYRGY